MAMIRWLGSDDALTRLERMQRDMDRLMNAAFPATGSYGGTGVYPLMNVYDDSESFFIHAEVPGVDPEALDISVTGNTLTITGERRPPDLPENASFHRRERDLGTFRRSLTLPERVDASRVEARVVNGVLEIRLPRAEEAKPRKIEIEGK